jgi:hypothetical protein
MSTGSIYPCQHQHGIRENRWECPATENGVPVSGMDFAISVIRLALLCGQKASVSFGFFFLFFLCTLLVS